MPKSRFDPNACSFVFSGLLVTGVFLVYFEMVVFGLIVLLFDFSFILGIFGLPKLWKSYLTEEEYQKLRKEAIEELIKKGYGKRE